MDANSLEPAVSYERLHYRAPFGHVYFMVVLRPAVSSAQIAAAIASMLQRTPLLRSSIVQRRDGTAFFRPNATDGVEVQEFRSDPSEWLVVAERCNREPFKMSTHPMVRCYVLRAPERVGVMICAHHAACDGLSLAYAAEDLVRDIAGEPQIRSPATAASVRAELSSDLRARPSGLASVLNRLWQTEARLFSDEEYDAMYRSFWETSGHAVREWELGPDQLDRLTTACRRQETTVTAALLTALHRARLEVEGSVGGKPYRDRCALAVNMRDALRESPGRACGVFAAAIALSLGGSPSDFWREARVCGTNIRAGMERGEFAKTMAFQMELEPTLIDSLYFHRYAGFASRASTRLAKALAFESTSYGLAMSNLGVVLGMTPRAAALVESAHFLPPYWPTSERTAGIVTSGRRLNATISFDTRYTQSGHVEQWLDAADDILRRSCV